MNRLISEVSRILLLLWYHCCLQNTALKVPSDEPNFSLLAQVCVKLIDLSMWFVLLFASTVSSMAQIKNKYNDEEPTLTKTMLANPAHIPRSALDTATAIVTVSEKDDEMG